MVEAKSRRGRPVGTGIDDSDRIARLAELLKLQPELKPTTAIRCMGYTDPSAIRRLRDKYKQVSRPQAGSGRARSVTPARHVARSDEAALSASAARVPR
jgi:hypothetical protein